SPRDHQDRTVSGPTATGHRDFLRSIVNVQNLTRIANVPRMDKVVPGERLLVRLDHPTADRIGPNALDIDGPSPGGWDVVQVLHHFIVDTRTRVRKGQTGF
ncbi:MAG TPA: hypothetical protein VNT26_07065, partial [Candidatus Sulfotelmatobacter sp.]|nr:hypothetical protein [Candidatus Sulfotelmatobacter sp.]